MACLELEPGAAEWKAQTNPLSYNSTPNVWTLFQWHCFLFASPSQNAFQLPLILWIGREVVYSLLRYSSMTCIEASTFQLKYSNSD